MHKFKIKEILDTKPKREIPILIGIILQKANLKRDGFNRYLYAKKGSKINIPSDKLLIIASVLNVKVDDLLGKDSIPEKSKFDLVK